MDKNNVEIFLTNDEYDLLKKEADKMKVTVAMYIKESVLKEYLHRKDK